MLRILVTGVLSGLTAVCLYTAYITGKNRDMQSAWFFIAFSFLFAVPLVVVIIKALGQKNSGFRKLYDKLAGQEQQGVRFVPHWFTMLIFLIFGIIVAVNIIKIVLGIVKS